MRTITVGNPPTSESANVGRVESKATLMRLAALTTYSLVTEEQNTVERSMSRWSGLGLFHGDSKVSPGGIEIDSPRASAE